MSEENSLSKIAIDGLKAVIDIPGQIGTQLTNSSFALAKDIVDNSVVPDQIKASINNNLEKIYDKIPKSEREMKRNSETAALGFIETVPPEIMTKAFFPLLLSLVNEGKAPDNYSIYNKAAAKSDIETCLFIIKEYKQELFQYYSGGKSPKDRTALQGASFAAKKQLETYLSRACLKLNLPKEAFEHLARDHFLWLVRDKGIDFAVKSSKTLAKLGLKKVISILDMADTVRFAVRDAKSRKYLQILLDNIFYGGAPLSGMSPEQRVASGVPQTRWTKQGKIVPYKGNKEKEKTMPKNVSENKILKEYILRNGGDTFEDTPFGQIVADEVNKAVANIPEIKLALEQLAEQSDVELEMVTKKLGRDYAVATLTKVREEMIDKIPQMVEEILADLMDKLER